MTESYDERPGMYSRGDPLPIGCVLFCIISGLILVLTILFSYWVWRFGITITEANS